MQMDNGDTHCPGPGWGRRRLPHFTPPSPPTSARDGTLPSRAAAVLRALLGLGLVACCFLISGWEEAAFRSGRNPAVQSEIPGGEDAPDRACCAVNVVGREVSRPSGSPRGAESVGGCWRGR